MKIRRSTPRDMRDPEITATFRAWAARESRVAEYHAESDGVFIVLARGYSDPHGAHTIRGDNATDAMRRFRDRARACVNGTACDYCSERE